MNNSGRKHEILVTICLPGEKPGGDGGGAKERDFMPFECACIIAQAIFKKSTKGIIPPSQYSLIPTRLFPRYSWVYSFARLP